MCFTKNMPLELCGIVGRKIDARDVERILVEKTQNQLARIVIVLKSGEPVRGEEYPLVFTEDKKRELEMAHHQTVYGD